MTTTDSTGAALFLAVDLPARGAAHDLVPRAVSAIRAFAAAGVGLAMVSDDLRPAPAGQARVDAPTLAAFAAPAVPGIGLAPAVSTTHTEPFHLAKVVQTLDHASRGRAAWQVLVSTSAGDAALLGRRAAPDEKDAWAEAEEAIEVAERLWDSWEDDAEIRDETTGRFIDRDRVHHIDFAGRFFAVRGPSITPRSPQGRPPIVVSATGPVSLDVAARRADVIRVGPLLVGDARAAVERAGRTGRVTVLVDVAVASAADVERAVETAALADGVVLVFDDIPDADGWAHALAPFARARPGNPTLRDRLGLPRPASRYSRTSEGTPS